jgi:quinol monooxygenase YgiN
VIIVAGALFVDPGERAGYLAGCEEVVTMARGADGCIDFALSPDLLDDARINVYEQWESAEQLGRFRGSGPDSGQLAALREVHVREYEAAELGG